jgi:hypothetical protein
MQTNIKKQDISPMVLIKFRCNPCSLFSATLICPRCGQVGKTTFDLSGVKKTLSEYSSLIQNYKFSNGRKQELLTLFNDLSESVEHSLGSILNNTFSARILPGILNDIKLIKESYPQLNQTMTEFEHYIKNLIQKHPQIDTCLDFFASLYNAYAKHPSTTLIHKIDLSMNQFFSALAKLKEQYSRFSYSIASINLFQNPDQFFRRLELQALIHMIEFYRPIFSKSNYTQEFPLMEVR